MAIDPRELAVELSKTLSSIEAVLDLESMRKQIAEL